MTSLNKVFADLPVTIFEAMSQLARDNNAINLGQGFPDDPGPEDIRRAAADATVNGYNQYPSMMGIPELRQAIAAHYGRWHGLALDPMTEVMVTSGGTEALTSAILAVVEPGDEVVVFQPVYDSYLPIIRQAGGIPRLVRLEPPHWRLTEEALRREIKEETDLDICDVEFVLVQDCIHSKEFYRDAHFILLNYTCRCAGGPRVKLNEEAREFRWVKPQEALAMPLNQPTRRLLLAVAKKSET